MSPPAALLQLMIGDDDFILDAEGNHVLIGLTLEETQEFYRLEKNIGETFPLLSISPIEWCRQLELWDKHRAAKGYFVRGNKSYH